MTQIDINKHTSHDRCVMFADACNFFMTRHNSNKTAQHCEIADDSYGHIYISTHESWCHDRRVMLLTHAHFVMTGHISKKLPSHR
jgi:hypothetical protein